MGNESYSVVSGLALGSSETIGFVVSSLFCGAINRAEFKEWCLHVIVSNEMDEIPPYIGFVPSWGANEETDNVLLGIAYLRGLDVFDPPIPRNDAIESVRRHRNLYDRFREVFPFIELPAV